MTLPGKRSLRVGVTAALLGAAAFWLSLATLVFFNDHFGRISPARQIVMYGDRPFRDYFDPGYFLTELSSAAMLSLLGDNLLGEALLTTAFIASGTVLVFLLSFRVTGSAAVSLSAAVIALMLLPRAYDYDKVLFYPLGVLLCWRYIEQPRVGRLWAFAVGAVAAALFRYDNGVYLAAGMVVAVAIVHAGEWRLIRDRLIHLAFAMGCLALPVLLIIHLQGGGLIDAIDQMVAYARRETARTALPAQRFVFESLATVASSDNADVFLGYVLRLLPFGGLLLILLDARSGRTSPGQVAQVASLVTLCVCLNVFVLRDPIGARLGGMAGPAAILAAWIAQRAWRAARTPLLPRLITALLTIITIWSVSASARWSVRLHAEMLRPEHPVRVLQGLAAAGRQDSNANLAIAGLVKYLRECTAPDDRVLATWFAPDLYFYAQRGFAARAVALFGGHWSEPRFERRSLDAMAAQPVPVVLMRAGDRFTETYPNLATHVREQYRLAGTSTFGDPDVESEGYSVWVRRDRQPLRTYAGTSLPCF